MRRSRGGNGCSPHTEGDSKNRDKKKGSQEISWDGRRDGVQGRPRVVTRVRLSGPGLFWNGLKHAGKRNTHQLGAVHVDPRQRTGSDGVQALSWCSREKLLPVRMVDGITAALVNSLI